MPLVLQPADEHDALRAAEIERLAYADNRLSPVLFPGPFPEDSLEKRAAALASQLKEDPTARWVKVIDTDVDQMIAWAKWNIHEEPCDAPWNRQFGSGCNVEACQEFFGGMHRKRSELMAGKPHCLLAMLQADPNHRGRGAGGMLIEWGLNVANSLRLPAYLESSPQAHTLYHKYGFRDIDEFRIDPKWTGEPSADADVYFMLRETE